MMGQSLRARTGIPGALLVLIFTAAAAAGAAAEDSPGELVGRWTARDPVGGIEVPLVLNADGTGTFDGDPIRYAVRADAGQIVVTDQDGERLTYGYRLSGDRLVLSGGDLEEAFTFARQGAAAKGKERPGPAGPATAPADGDGKPPGDALPAAAARGVVGTWKADDGATFTFAPDGTAEFPTGRLRYVDDGRSITLTGPNGELRFEYRISGDAMTITVGEQTQTLRRAAAGRRGGPGVGGGAAGGPAAAGVAGVYVCTESSVDPTIVMTFTQYVTLYPDGSVGYAKSEGGATRTAISEQLERFTQFRNGPGPEQVAGRWESDGARIVVRWNLWNNLVSEGEVQAGAITLSGMGTLDEGATLRFDRQE